MLNLAKEICFNLTAGEYWTFDDSPDSKAYWKNFLCDEEYSLWKEIQIQRVNLLSAHSRCSRIVRLCEEHMKTEPEDLVLLRIKRIRYETWYFLLCRIEILQYVLHIRNHLDSINQ